MEQNLEKLFLLILAKCGLEGKCACGEGEKRGALFVMLPYLLARENKEGSFRKRGFMEAKKRGHSWLCCREYGGKTVFF
jgi:hypothetical protein